MQIYKQITPRFFKSFSCNGSDCLMTCCQGWNIYINKKTYHSYINSTDPVIAEIAKENLILTRKGKRNYSVMKFNSQGICPFVDEHQLCSIQCKMGEQALSHTCAVYPRLKNEFLDETRHSLTISCPEAVRNVLFDEQSMLLEENSELKARAKKKFSVQTARNDERSQLIHLFAWNIIKSPSLRVEQNLSALAHFILYLQRIQFDIYNRLDEVEAYYNELLMMLGSGGECFEAGYSDESLKLKIKLLTMLGVFVASKNNRSGYIKDAHRLLTEFIDPARNSGAASLKEKFARLELEWQNLCSTSCLKEPYVLRNYLLYQIYNSHFPNNSLPTMLRQYSLIVQDFFYIKHLLAVRALSEEVTPAVVMITIASFAEKMMHSETIKHQINSALDAINCGDDLSSLLLLR